MPGIDQRHRWPQHDRKGSWLIDEDGRRLLAWHVAGGTFNLGFGDESMARAVAGLVMEHDAGMWSMRSERRLEGEAEFNRLFPAPLARTFFTPSASEAFEVACKLARATTGRPNFVSVVNGYYGAIGFALAMDDPRLGPEVFSPFVGAIPKAEFGSIESMDALVDENTAAVCLETVQVPAGVYEQPPGYLAEVRRLCDERGALLILDEVQGGLYRTGELWAFQRHGIVPDMVVTGKGLSAGYYPLGALTTTAALFERFDRYPLVHRSSFSGGEIAARVAAVTSNRYLDPELAAHVSALSTLLGDGLARLAAEHPAEVVEVRGRGLLYGVQLRSVAAGAFAHRCRDLGLYLHATLEPHTVQVMPALTATEGEVRLGLERFEAALAGGAPQPA